MLNTEYDREFIFDVDAYLIENYKSMTLKIRRSICAQIYDWIDEEVIQDSIDSCVANYAMEQLELQKVQPDPEDE